MKVKDVGFADADYLEEESLPPPPLLLRSCGIGRFTALYASSCRLPGLLRMSVEVHNWRREVSTAVKTTKVKCHFSKICRYVPKTDLAHLV